ncbi:hypothetical protein LCGC14_1383020 [marine sediment metagenome]|uniref:Uncharacterized protein n=1 Tax=marine sediment metagenome TaxID=412755 RepID=A0A0F9K2C3_9ZZZZ
MELKTLKDLETDWLMSTKEKGKGWKFVNTTRLQQEVIKWVKDMRRSDTKHRNKITSETWAMHFFNITEEDLK